MTQKSIPNLLFTIARMHIGQLNEFNFQRLIHVIDSNLNWKGHLSASDSKISRVFGLLHK